MLGHLARPKPIMAEMADGVKKWQVGLTKVKMQAFWRTWTFTMETEILLKYWKKDDMFGPFGSLPF